jgi:phosphate transport system substrate-binding protein
MNTSLRSCLILSCLAASAWGRTLPKPATPAETELFKQQGRTLPQPEVLQPTLDPQLEAFEPHGDRTATAHYHAASSDVLAVLSKNWAKAFQKYYPNVTIDIPPPYAGSLGALELIKGNLDFVFVSRELKPSDISGFHKKFGYDPSSTPIIGGTFRHFGFLDSIAFAVNPANPISHLTFKQLDQILSSTHVRGGEAITTWGQLGLTGEWADKPIHVWAVKPWNGFEEFVRERVLSVGNARGERRTDLNYVETVFPVNPQVAKDKYSIGYAGRAYLGDDVKLISLAPEEGGPAIAPDYDEVARAEYPLSRVAYFNMNRNPAKPLDPIVSEFLRFILSREGQQVVLDQAIYLPLRANQAEQSLASLK